VPCETSSQVKALPKSLSVLIFEFYFLILKLNAILTGEMAKFAIGQAAQALAKFTAATDSPQDENDEEEDTSQSSEERKEGYGSAEEKADAELKEREEAEDSEEED
jgi:hypothetical protein